jgi:RNA polymerase sigma-70 factor (ECF subfamily)
MNTEQDPDVLLMLAFQRGDDAAYEELVRRNYRRILNLAYRFIGSREDADDLAQEVCLGVYKARQSYRPTARFSTWLYKNTLNLCLNYNRSMRLRRTLSLVGADESGEETPRDLPDEREGLPFDELERKELQEKVREAVESLPPNQRAAVLLSRFEKLSYKEIADVMDLSVQAVKSLLSRAKENLRYKLAFYLGRADEGDEGLP